MMHTLFDKMKAQRTTVWHSGLDEQTLSQVMDEQRIRLPSDHQQLLRVSNGVEFFDGYERLFGVKCTESIDAISWNRQQCWKFAWGDRCTGFWCFGESIWGHQYAYALDELDAPGEPNVYDLDAYEMVSEKIAESFADFVTLILIRDEPIDKMSRDAHAKFGAVDAKINLIHSPPFVLLPQEDMYNLEIVTKMDSVSAMICNGDAALQLASAPDDALFKGVESFVDEEGRSRIKLLWG